MSSGTRSTNVNPQENSTKSWKVLEKIAIVFGILCGSDFVLGRIIDEDNRDFRELISIGFTMLICLVIFYIFSEQYKALAKKLYQKSKRFFYAVIIILIAVALAYFAFRIGQYFPKTELVTNPPIEESGSTENDSPTTDTILSPKKEGSIEKQTSDFKESKPSTGTTIKTKGTDNKKDITKTDKPKIRQEAVDNIQPERCYIFIGTFSKAENKFVKFKLADNKKRDLNTLMNVQEIQIKARSSVYENKPNEEPKMSDVIYVAPKNTTLEVMSISVAYSTRGLDYYYADVKFKK